jgi:hypothetical protein
MHFVILQRVLTLPFLRACAHVECVRELLCVQFMCMWCRVV